MVFLSFLGFFLTSILFYFNKGYKSANFYLAFFLFFLNLLVITNYLYIYIDSKVFIAYLLSIPFNGIGYLIGPLAFLYVKSTLKDNNSFGKYDWAHFIVFAIIFLGRLPHCFLSWDTKLLIADKIINYQYINGNYWSFNFIMPMNLNFKLKALHFLLYILAIWYLILKNKFKNPLLTERPKETKIVENWLYFFVGIISLLSVLFALMVLNILDAKDKMSFRDEGNILFLLIFIGFLILILGLILFPKILYGKPFFENASLTINEDKISEPKKNKIEKFSFDSDYIDEIRLLLENWKVEKKYLDIDSSTFSLSKDINIPNHHVTYFFNNSSDEKYIDWRNRLRIEHAIKLIKNKEGFHKTIESIGKESGFRANSAFLRCFKQFTGKLPNDIIKEHKS
jgi:hypothetical protein